MRAVIFGGGTVEKSCIPLISDEDYVICADGGCDRAAAAGITPDIVLGDMDSVKGGTDGLKTVTFPCRKDETDSELAVEYALAHGYDELIMLGFTGTRLDHTAANLTLLKRIAQRGARGVIIDAHNEIYYIEKMIKISGRRGSLLSVIPLEGDMEGVSTKGLDYPLCNETLYFGKSRGVSNVITADECEITVHSGGGLIILAKD